MFFRLSPWIVVFSASLFFFFEFIQMTVFNSISSALMQSFQITGTQFGLLSAAYFYANVLFLFPVGLLLDRFSTRKLILTAFGLCITSTFLIAWAQHYYIALIARFLIGAGSTLCLLSASRLASRWLPPQQLGLAIGSVVTLAMLGGFIAQTPMTLLIEFTGWREALTLDAFMGIVFWLIIYYNVQDFPSNYETQHKNNLIELQQKGFLKSIAQALSNPQNWLGGLYTCLLNLSIFIIGSSFGTLFLEQVYKFSKAKASFACSMIFLGTLLGSPILGYISDRLGSRKYPMIFFSLASCLFISLIFFFNLFSWILICTIIFAIGFFSSAQVISYPLIAESNAPALTSSAIALASTLIMGGGALFQPLFGYLLNLEWNNTRMDGIAYYSAHNFHQALLILPTAAWLSVVISLFVKETYARGPTQ